MIIYHHNDQDGFVAANLAYHAFKDLHPNKNVRFKALNYEGPFPFELIEPREEVIIVDLSFDSETIKVFDEIFKRTVVVHWFDHHKTSILALEKPENKKYRNIPGLRNDKYCGAMLTYFYYFTNISSDMYNMLEENKKINLNRLTNEIPTYIRMTDDFDCWKDTSSYVMDLAVCMRTVNDPLDPMLQNLYISSFKKSDMEVNKIVMDLCSIGHSINDYLKATNAQQLKDNGFEATIVYEVDAITRRIHVLALNASGNSTLFGDKINDYDAVVRFTYNGNTKLYKYSIFSKTNGANCREVAEYFHGGGHDHAAGFTRTELIFNDVDMHM